MTIAISQSAIEAGFVTDNLGAHTSRTMMLAELRMLLAACPASASLGDYRAMAVEQNVLMKPTLDARQKSIRHLRQLYGLSLDLSVFRVLRELWDSNPEGQPLLALLCTLARDPILRSSVELISSMPVGDGVTPNQCQQAIAGELGNQLSTTTQASAARNVLSSWEQSGHLKTIAKEKIRQQVQTTPVVTAYALFLAYLNGERGEGMFFSPWCRVLDQPAHILRAQVEQASKQGWLEYRDPGLTNQSFYRIQVVVP